MQWNLRIEDHPRVPVKLVLVLKVHSVAMIDGIKSEAHVDMGPHKHMCYKSMEEAMSVPRLEMSVLLLDLLLYEMARERYFQSGSLTIAP